MGKYKVPIRRVVRYEYAYVDVEATDFNTAAQAAESLELQGVLHERVYDREEAMNMDDWWEFDEDGDIEQLAP